MRRLKRLAFIVHSTREIIFDMDYTNNYKFNELSAFLKYIATTERGMMAPICEVEGQYYSFLLSDDVCILLLLDTKGSKVRASDKIAALQLLDRLNQVCHDLLGKLTASNLLTNVAMLAEIVDTMIIGGYPHLTDTEKVRLHVVSEHVNPRMVNHPVNPNINVARKVPVHTATEGYKPSLQQPLVSKSTSKEELFADMIETVHMNVKADGCMTGHVDGSLNLKFSGNSRREAKVHLKGGLDKFSPSFHEMCQVIEPLGEGRLIVDLPVGETKLLTYSLPVDKQPFVLKATQAHNGDHDLQIALHCNLPAGVMCVNTRIALNLPPGTANVSRKFSGVSHTADFDRDTLLLNWIIPELAGQTDCFGIFKIISTKASEKLNFPDPLHLTLNFELSNYLMSGLCLQSIKIEGQSHVKRWIRHVTVSGVYDLQLTRT